MLFGSAGSSSEERGIRARLALCSNRAGTGMTGDLLADSSERGHAVIDTGPYAFVRHPGYVGGLVMALGTALSLWFLVGLGSCR